MSSDPWSRPTAADLKRVLESIGDSEESHGRTVERLELSVPAEVITARGNVVSCMTREISRLGIGLFHKGSITPGEVQVKLASDTREFLYRVNLGWCQPCDGGMFISGGTFIEKIDPNE